MSRVPLAPSSPGPVDSESGPRHAVAVARVSVALSGSGLAVVDELRLDETDPATRSRSDYSPPTPRSRLTFLGSVLGPTGVGYVIVETSAVGVSAVSRSSLTGPLEGTGAHLAPRTRRRGGPARTREESEATTNHEVARVHDVLTHLDSTVASTLLAASLGFGLHRVHHSVFVPETDRRERVLAATRLLSALADGAPVEWALRRLVSAP